MFQSNVIEAAPDMQRESEKEWYYGNADKERLGPYSYEDVSIMFFTNLIKLFLVFCKTFS